MDLDFAALRFTADENLKDRVYWYLDPVGLAAGEEALAPVGVHDRLQRAVVERTLTAPAELAPYDLSLIKRITARYGDRMRQVEGEDVLDFGGVRYDAKHYTRFSALFLSRKPVEMTGICLLEEPSADDDDVYRAILHGPVLLAGGEGKELFRRLYALLRGDERPLYGLGLGDRDFAALRSRLG